MRDGADRVRRRHLRAGAIRASSGASSASSVVGASGAVIGALLLAACNTDDSVVELGRIEHYGAPAIVEAPASVRVGQPFRVSVVTYGGGCVSPERTDIESSGEVIDVLPFDRRDLPGANEACTDELRLFPHEATLIFDVAGAKTIRIHGRRVSFHVDEAIQIPLAVVVE